jgi:hypothetical protein
MGRVALALALAALLALAPHASSGGRVRAQTPDCGTDRQDVETLSDPDVSSIDLTQIIGVNISTLAALPPPDPLPTDSRFNPYETTVYSTTGDLIQAQMQPDQDIVVEMEDPTTGDTMTVAIPDAAQCATGASPQFIQLMEQARSAFVQNFGTPSAGAPMPLSGSAAVIGVGFLDPVLGQQGEASNGFELHPLLDFEPSSATLPAAPPASVTPSATPTPEATATPAPASLPQTSATPPAHRYYVNKNGSQQVIYCDTDPALQTPGQQMYVVFSSLDAALAAYPGYQLDEAC